MPAEKTRPNVIETFYRTIRSVRGDFLNSSLRNAGGSEDILKAKAARTARKLKGLTFRLWKSGDTAYQYQIENMMTKSTGTYTTWGSP